MSSPIFDTLEEKKTEVEVFSANFQNVKISFTSSRNNSANNLKNLMGSSPQHSHASPINPQLHKNIMKNHSIPSDSVLTPQVFLQRTNSARRKSFNTLNGEDGLISGPSHFHIGSPEKMTRKSSIFNSVNSGELSSIFNELSLQMDQPPSRINTPKGSPNAKVVSSSSPMKPISPVPLSVSVSPPPSSSRLEAFSPKNSSPSQRNLQQNRIFLAPSHVSTMISSCSQNFDLYSLFDPEQTPPKSISFSNTASPPEKSTLIHSTSLPSPHSLAATVGSNSASSPSTHKYWLSTGLTPQFLECSLVDSWKIYRVEVDAFDIDEMSIQFMTSLPSGSFTVKLLKESSVAVNREGQSATHLSSSLAHLRNKLITFYYEFSEPHHVDTSTNMIFFISKALRAFYGIKKIRITASK